MTGHGRLHMAPEDLAELRTAMGGVKVKSLTFST